jgi:hypothetical protein
METLCHRISYRRAYPPNRHVECYGELDKRITTPDAQMEDLKQRLDKKSEDPFHKQRIIEAITEFSFLKRLLV